MAAKCSPVLMPPPGLDFAPGRAKTKQKSRKDEASAILTFLAEDMNKRIQRQLQTVPSNSDERLCDGTVGLEDASIREPFPWMDSTACDPKFLVYGESRQQPYDSADEDGRVSWASLLAKPAESEFHKWRHSAPFVPIDHVRDIHSQKQEPPASPTTCSTQASEPESPPNIDSYHFHEEPCRWHESAKLVGQVSADGHVFTKVAGPEKYRAEGVAAGQRLSSICMVFDQRLRYGGYHVYRYQILSGEVGPADGAGFVFDSKIRRSNLQRMRSIFLNSKGQICLRNQQQVQKLRAALPRMEVGMCLTLTVDLHNLCFHFMLSNPDGTEVGTAEVWLGSILCNVWDENELSYWKSGFFCAVVTKDISVCLE